MKKINSCFVLSPIGERGSETRKHADQVLHHVISPVTQRLGISVERSDRIDEAGPISQQILERILGADLIIADLSKHNPNVFYELAIRHFLQRPSIHLISESDRLPFDVSQFRAIPFDLTDPDSIVAAKTSLERQIENATMTRISLLGAELEKKLDEQIISRGCKHFARIAVALPEFPGTPFLPSKFDHFQVLEPDELSLSSLRRYLEVELATVNRAISVISEATTRT